MANLVVHFEIHASEPQRLIEFYSALFGWTFTRFGEVDYWAIDTGDGAINRENERGRGINGGLTQRMGPRPEPGAPVTGANLVVGIDDSDGGDAIDRLFARGLELGAREALPLDDMPGIGRLGYLLDPDGNVFGVISPRLSDGTVAM